MKKEKKFTLEKFQVAKLKNMKKVIGGNGTADFTIITTTGNDQDPPPNQGPRPVNSSVACTD